MKHPLRIREEAKNDIIAGTKTMGVTTLKMMVVFLGIMLIVLALYVNNPLALAGILAWVILP